MPFAQAQQELAALQGVEVSSATLRRQTMQAGEGGLQVELQRAHPLSSCPEEVPGTRMIMSNDGAMVSLRHQAWGEVRLVVLGHVQVKKTAKGPEVPSDHLSYFARLTTAETFTDQASAEIRRRALDRATEVCAVQDGAEWITRMVQAHRTDAVSILDFPHAAERIAAIARFLEGSTHALPASWVQQQLHQLKHEGPEGVLKELHAVSERAGKPEGIEEHIRYLSKRVQQMHYPSYQQAQWPIGSGIVESGHKVVMQARRVWSGDALETRKRQPDVGVVLRSLQRSMGRDVARTTRLEPAPPPANPPGTLPETTNPPSQQTKGIARPGASCRCRGGQSSQKVWTHTCPKSLGTTDFFSSPASTRKLGVTQKNERHPKICNSSGALQQKGT